MECTNSHIHGLYSSGTGCPLCNNRINDLKISRKLYFDRIKELQKQINIIKQDIQEIDEELNSRKRKR